MLVDQKIRPPSSVLSPWMGRRANAASVLDVDPHPGVSGLVDVQRQAGAARELESAATATAAAAIADIAAGTTAAIAGIAGRTAGTTASAAAIADITAGTAGTSAAATIADMAAGTAGTSAARAQGVRR
jgi:hypothetical protein